jgi:carbon storage regulator
MLILRRKAGESIVLNGKITVTVLAVERERVKIGVDAPPEVSVVRQELLHRSQAQKAEQKQRTDSDALS